MENSERRITLATSRTECSSISRRSCCRSCSDHSRQARFVSRPNWRAKRRHASRGLLDRCTRLAISSLCCRPRAVRLLRTRSLASLDHRNVLLVSLTPATAITMQLLNGSSLRSHQAPAGNNLNPEFPLPIHSREKAKSTAIFLLFFCHRFVTFELRMRGKFYGPESSGSTKSRCAKAKTAG